MLTVSPSMHCARGVSAPGRVPGLGGVCSGGAWSWEDVCSVGVPGPGGCLVPGVVWYAGCVLKGGAWSRRGVSALRGCLVPVWCVSQHALRQTPPVTRILDTRY